MNAGAGIENLSSKRRDAFAIVKAACVQQAAFLQPRRRTGIRQ
jgi:hypothetical protein